MHKVVTGEDAAATILATKLRELTAPLERTLPKGAVIASVAQLARDGGSGLLSCAV